MNNWYKIAKLEQQLKAEAGLKQDLIKTLSTSVFSAMMLIFELGAINRSTIDEAAQRAHLNDQEKNQLEQVVQDPNIISRAQQILQQQNSQPRPSMEITVPRFSKLPQEQNRQQVSDDSNVSEVSMAPIINVGKDLIGRGFKVGYHPNFSYVNGFDDSGKQRVGEHSKHSYHYKNQAFDISGASIENMQSLFDELYRRRSELGITELIYDKRGHWFSKSNRLSSKPYGGHGNHIHVAFGTPGLVRKVNEM